MTTVITSKGGSSPFEEWVTAPTPPGLRRGQHLFNTAPSHVTSIATGILWLDCFHAEEGDPRIERFIDFANLIWDLPALNDKLPGHDVMDELEAAIDLVRP